MRQMKQTKLNLIYILAILLCVALLLSLYVTITRQDDYVKHTPGTEAPAGDAALQTDSDLQSSVQQTLQGSENENLPPTKEADIVIQPSAAAQGKEQGYVLVVESGCLQVYDRATHELYMETSIPYQLLPDQLQREIDNGKYFLSEEALLEFLENYSS